MAYIDQVKKEDENQTGMNVLGQPAPGQAQPTTVDPNAQQAPQPQQTPMQAKVAKPSSSGMFTGIKKYMQANQPAAQKMVGTIGAGQENKATQIAKNAELQKQRTQQQLAANNTTLANATTGAANIVQGATGVQVTQPSEGSLPTTKQEYSDAPKDQQIEVYETGRPTSAPVTPPPAVTAPTLTDEHQSLFSQYLAGDSGASDVADVNFTEQRQGLDQVRNLARGITGEQGRGQALYDTFGRKRDYTTGQTGLDSALLGSAAPQLQELRNRLVQNEAAKRQQLQGIESELGGQVGMYRKDLGEFGSKVRGYADEALNKTNADVDAQLATLNAQQEAAMADLRDGIDVSQVGNYVSDQQLMESAAGEQSSLKKALKFLDNPGDRSGFGDKDDVDSWNNNFAAVTGISGNDAYKIYNRPGGKEQLQRLTQDVLAKTGDIGFLKQKFADRSRTEDLSSIIGKSTLNRGNAVNQNQLAAFANLKRLIGRDVPVDLQGGRVEVGSMFNPNDISNLTTNNTFSNDPGRSLGVALSNAMSTPTPNTNTGASKPSYDKDAIDKALKEQQKEAKKEADKNKGSDTDKALKKKQKESKEKSKSQPKLKYNKKSGKWEMD